LCVTAEFEGEGSQKGVPTNKPPTQKY